MAFQFALESVLRLRESIEEREERTLLAAQLEVKRLEHRADELRKAMAGGRDRREALLRSSMYGGQLHLLSLEEQASERELRAVVGQLRLAEQKRDEQRAIYHAAHRDREMLSSMQLKQRKAHDLQGARDEQKMLDDLFNARRLRI